jgi:secreted Zn-dependent insulinase-like peptidase
MPAPASLTTHTLILPNGLHVVLCHAPRLKRCAAALRVAAGSHDVPQEWPGLAHFLEHLFFLGTERFPAAQNLMAFVQRHGGQVNASTRERTTDFFFELPPPVFADGLERLCEMLAHPRMAVDDQLREREVLHAEFIAWSRDEAARDQMKRLAPISMDHPLRWFHAGNRYSLLVPRASFQQALKDFYQRFYQAGQMTLSIAGPQPLAELKRLAERFGGLFAAGQRVEQRAPVPLMDGSFNGYAARDSRRTHLMFACEDLPDSADEAVGFLCFWLANAQAGGLIAALKARGWAETLTSEVMYQFQGQALINIEVALPAVFAGKRAPTDQPQSTVGGSLLAIKPAQPTVHDQVTALFFDWLMFFKTYYPALRTEYALLQQRRLDVGGALMLARHYSETPSRQAIPGLSDQGARALEALIDQLRADTFSPPLNPAKEADVPWRLPPANAFLHSAPLPAVICPPLTSLTFSDALPDSSGDGAVYLRWTLKNPAPALWQMLADSLKSLIDDAQQAGVSVAFTAYGNHWQLKVDGLTDPMPAVIEAVLKRLAQPDPTTLALYGQPSTEPRLIPIRQLLKTLPDHLMNRPSAKKPDTEQPLQSVWDNASWSGLALGFSLYQRNALLHAMSKTPGTPEKQILQPPSLPAGRRWHTEPSESSENAVLVFCPAPSHSSEDQARWRLLAHIVQTPFYQRLRVELQLGYAVFSGFRQIEGQSGILFGVQSPSATAEELAQHIEQFIEGMPALIASSDVAAERLAVVAQFDPAAMETVNAAQWWWNAHLAGFGDRALEDMKHYLSNFHEADLQAAFADLKRPDNARLYLSNRSSPGKSWR